MKESLLDREFDDGPKTERIFIDMYTYMRTYDGRLIAIHMWSR